MFWGDTVYMLSALYAIARPSVCLSVCLLHGWISQKWLKIGNLRIMKFSPYGSPIPLVSAG